MSPSAIPTHQPTAAGAPPVAPPGVVSPRGDQPPAGSANGGGGPQQPSSPATDLPIYEPLVHPYDEVTWVKRTAKLGKDGSVFLQHDVEFPDFWSQNAVNITTQKYFRRPPNEETSLKQLIDRVVLTIIRWGTEGGYFADADEATGFGHALTELLLHQRASFNSPVWFNLGVPDEQQQCSACFILAVDDTMESILNWYREEGMIFKYGSGAGTNLSKVRASSELLSGGGKASGPVSFMHAADASAGSIKSGGKTRRAAKMVVLDADHPDVEDFIWCKANEERKAHSLTAAGFDMGLNGADAVSIAYQNANNSVRVTDEFMEAAMSGGAWDLIARRSGEVVRSVSASDLLDQIAKASWQCADPGVQFDTTINRWHTTPKAGRISASNPCSEYMHIDNSACNLASINLLPFLADDGTFGVEEFQAAVDTVFYAQDILISRAHYPTPEIEANTKKFRQIGLGYSNLGAMLMTMGLPYDSDEARRVAAAVTAIMGGAAYAASGHLAEQVGAFGDWHVHRDDTIGVIGAHAAAAAALPDDASGLRAAAQATWQEAVELAAHHGVRNAQATVLAPTGTISFMMDCDTTGVEPDFALRKIKVLAGGGTMEVVNRAVPRALDRLGYDPAQRDQIIAHITEHGHVDGCAMLRKEHRAIFACSTGPKAIAPSGHVDMLAAVQPFLSGAISKTVNMPQSATEADVRDLIVRAWRNGVKAVAIYRDNSKASQPLAAASTAVTAPPRQRHKLPRIRDAHVASFTINDCNGYIIVGEYPDGAPGEVFLSIAKQGSTLSGIMDTLAISISMGLQHGVTLATYVQRLVGMSFEPAGITNDPDIRFAKSISDYLGRYLALRYLPLETRAALSIYRTSERAAMDAGAPDVSPDAGGGAMTPAVVDETYVDSSAPLCLTCGVRMIVAGSCHACPTCGATSGCS